MKIFAKLVLYTLLVLAIAYIVPGIDVITVWPDAVLAGLVIAFINYFIKPVLTLISLPVNILTLGIFGLILNAILFWVAGAIVPGFVVTGFLPALYGSIVAYIGFWFINTITNDMK